MRSLKHILFTSAIMLLIAMVPNYSSAEVIYIEPALNEDIALLVEENPELPLRILLPEHNIDLSVKFSRVVGSTWEVPEYNAGFGEGSSYINEDHGNSIIFAHARDGLFRGLKDVQYEDKITLIGENNIYEYKVDEIVKIYPEQIDLVKSNGEHHLTLFTCEGFGDEYRLLVKAKRTGVFKLNINKEVI